MRLKNMEEAPTYMILNQLMHISRYEAMGLLEEFDLKPSQAGVLFALNCNGKLSQRELAQKIGITPPSMTVTLRKMEELGYVVKEPDENDQRIIRIMITEKGTGCVDKIKAVGFQMEEVMYQGISKEERLFLRRLLIQMTENLLNFKNLNDADMATIMKHMHSTMHKHEQQRLFTDGYEKNDY